MARRIQLGRSKRGDELPEQLVGRLHAWGEAHRIT